jgi:hypothetical protein
MRPSSSTFRDLLVACAVATAACGCSPADPAPAACPNDLPSACPSAIPSYRSTVAPIVSRHCLGCHGAGGVAQSVMDLSSYSIVHANAQDVLSMVYSCRMPKDGQSPLSAQERGELLGWLVCGAPDN